MMAKRAIMVKNNGTVLRVARRSKFSFRGVLVYSTMNYSRYLIVYQCMLDFGEPLLNVDKF